MSIHKIIEEAKRIRQRLRNPPNAVYDPGIDLTRKSTAYKGDILPPDTPPKKKLEEPNVIPAIVFPIHFNEILYAVSRFYRVPVESLRGDRRFKPEVLARRVIVHLGIKLLGRSLSSIGRELNKDHSTIIHARNQIRLNLQTNAKLLGEVSSIEDTILAKYHNRSALPAIGQPSLEGHQGPGHQVEGIPLLAG